jgi:probable F420-dependent oxidoreductase
LKLDVGLSVDERQLPGAAEVARAAEGLGFAALWTNETKHDAFLPLALAAEHTRTLELGTAVAIAFSRSPMEMAQTAWDLQEYSGGRLLLGLGTQVRAHVERRFGMPWAPPVERLREYVGALRAIWEAFQTGEPLAFRGEHYRHTLMTPFFNPGPIDHPRIPIYIAGVNAGLAGLAGELCQGFHVHPFHSPEYVRQVVQPAVAEGAARAGRSPEDVALVSAVFAVTGADAAALERQRERTRQQLSFYASTPTYRVVLEVHGWEGVGERLSGLAKAGRWKEMPALITDEMLRAFAVEAAPEDLGAALRERCDGVLDRVSLYLPFVPGKDEAFWRATLRGVAGAS